MSELFAGIDWGSKLADADASRLVAGMEAAHGVMVEALLDRGVKTYSLNPKQLDRFRDRHSGAGAKDDALDAYVLAMSLRTDLKLFREVTLPSAERMRLAALSRSYDALTEQVLALANQVCEQLVRYYPQLLGLEQADTLVTEDTGDLGNSSGFWAQVIWVGVPFESETSCALPHVVARVG